MDYFLVIWCDFGKARRSFHKTIGFMVVFYRDALFPVLAPIAIKDEKPRRNGTSPSMTSKATAHATPLLPSAFYDEIVILTAKNEG